MPYEKDMKNRIVKWAPKKEAVFQGQSKHTFIRAILFSIRLGFKLDKPLEKYLKRSLRALTGYQKHLSGP
jgi:hypothetical protein